MNDQPKIPQPPTPDTWTPTWVLLLTRRANASVQVEVPREVNWRLSGFVSRTSNHPTYVVVIGYLDHAEDDLLVRISCAVVSDPIPDGVAQHLLDDDDALREVAFRTANDLLYSHATSTARSAAALVDEVYIPGERPHPVWSALEETTGE